MPFIQLRELAYPTQTNFEVLDGWQRITAIQAFILDGKIQLPESLRNVPQWAACVPDLFEDLGGYFEDLPEDKQNFIKNLSIEARIYTGLDDRTARELFYQIHPEMI